MAEYATVQLAHPFLLALRRREPRVAVDPIGSEIVGTLAGGDYPAVSTDDSPSELD